MDEDLVIPCVDALGSYGDKDPWFDLSDLDAVGIRVVKDLCFACPIRLDCLAQADRADASWAYGIWGGLTPAERRARRKNQAKDVA